MKAVLYFCHGNIYHVNLTCINFLWTLFFFLFFYFFIFSLFFFTLHTHTHIHKTDSGLARFLLRRAIRNPRLLGHQLFWSLKAEMHDPLVSDRYGVLLDMYRRNCGAHRGELGHQLFLMRQLQNVSDIVKPMKQDERKAVLKEKLEYVNQQLVDVDVVVLIPTISQQLAGAAGPYQIDPDIDSITFNVVADGGFYKLVGNNETIITAEFELIVEETTSGGIITGNNKIYPFTLASSQPNLTTQAAVTVDQEMNDYEYQRISFRRLTRRDKSSNVSNSDKAILRDLYLIK